MISRDIIWMHINITVVHKDLSKDGANFKTLCTGEKGVSETTGGTLPGGWIQGGDIIDG